MEFEAGHIFHVFNRGNNSQRLFFTRDNYLFFIEKIRTHVLPHADLLAWCLMPTHFHLMVHVNDLHMERIEQVTRSHPMQVRASSESSSFKEVRASLKVKP